MTASHLITATDSHVNLWDYNASECKKIVNLQIIRQNDSIREPIDAGVDPGSGHLKPEFRWVVRWFVDVLHILMFQYAMHPTLSRFISCDSICSLAASEKVRNVMSSWPSRVLSYHTWQNIFSQMLLVGMQSGAVRRYGLPHLQHEATYAVNIRPRVRSDFFFGNLW